MSDSDPLEAEPDLYERDPAAEPDSAFEPGELSHLLAGNAGRMLDPRRTPITITALDDATGSFELVVDAFEDRGALWRLPLEDVAGFQFAAGSRRASPGRESELRALVARFSRPLELPAAPEAREETLGELHVERARLRALLGERPELAAIDLGACIEHRQGSPAAVAVLAELMRAADLREIEREFAETYVSNPASGETVKAHAIVLAEMGLCPYAGRAVRDPGVFSGAGARELRRAHILLRLTFLAELAALLGSEELVLFRGMAVAGELEAPRPRSFVAATFSLAVAMSHFAAGEDRSGVLIRQSVPSSRLFMTFLETAEMNARYREAEAVLLGAPGNPLF